MAETVDSIVCEMSAPKPSAHASNVAQSLVHFAGQYQGTGASPADIAAGYRLAADQVAAWAEHGNWPRLRDGK